ncbi:hypothetical protein QOM21_21340 [Streptomyces sp. Pv4-95]
MGQERPDGLTEARAHVPAAVPGDVADGEWAAVPGAVPDGERAAVPGEVREGGQGDASDEAHGSGRGGTTGGATPTPAEDAASEVRSGVAGLESLPGVLEVRLAEPGVRVRASGDNNGYLGHIMAADAEGGGARDRVAELLATVRPRVAAR